MNTRSLGACLLVLVGACMLASPRALAAAAKTNRPNIYNESLDGSRQVADALVTAKRENKRVLLQFGANWCGWCHLLHELFEQDRAIREKLKADYVVVLIDVNQGHNKDVDEKYGRPTRHGLPVIVILDADGKPLTTQDTAKLEAGPKHDPAKVMAFLQAWAPRKTARASPAADSRTDAYELASYMQVGERRMFIVRNTATKRMSPWLELGQTWEGRVLTAFDPGRGQFTLTKDGIAVAFGIDPDGYQERFITVRASPQPGFASKPFERVILASAGKTYTSEWSPGAVHNPPVLLPGQVYDFVLIERSHPRRYGDRTWHEVWRVSAGDGVLFDKEVCEVHGERLQRHVVENTHGYTGMDFERDEVRRQQFPHAKTRRITTCIASPDEPSMIAICLCSQCEAAAVRWFAERERARPALARK
ncbi:MAG TPA: thioredoxin family protein [Opitutaceae bacterium]|nr:thioredoxin family protein [Opitutaceae bacterium]